MEQDKAKMLKLTTDQIEHKFGKGSIMKLGEDDRDLSIGFIPTGALPLDAALGIGGVPRGRIVEIYGPESSGKTTLALHILAEAQATGGIVAFIDAEHALDPVYAAKLGVDIDDVLISQPDTGEQALEICDMLVRSNAIDCVVIDSVAALVPRAEIEGEIGDTTVGLQARLMSQALRKLAGSLSKSNTTCIFINQLREKIGVMFGSPETTPGGRALKFFASVRLDIRRRDYVKKNGETIGNRVRVKVVKNKVAPPFRQAEFDIIYGKGISKEGCVLDMAAECGVVKKSGSWYTYGEERLGQGREAAKATLEQNPDLRNEIEYKVRDEYDIPQQEGAVPPKDAAGKAADAKTNEAKSADAKSTDAKTADTKGASAGKDADSKAKTASAASHSPAASAVSASAQKAPAAAATQKTTVPAAAGPAGK